MRLAFGDCLLDTDRRELRRQGRPVHLSPKAFVMLAALAEARPRVVTRAELHDRLWPRTFVSHTSLGRLLNEVRQALGDEARAPRYVRTVHSVGYAFCAETEEPAGTAPGPAFSAVRLYWGPREIALREGASVLGRSRDCEVWVGAEGVSRHHARIEVAVGRATVVDLGSRNGTFVGGERLQAPRLLADGDQLTLGTSVAMTVRLVQDADSTAAEAASP